MKGNKIPLFTALAALVFANFSSAKDAVEYVNPNIGSISHLTIPNRLNIQLPRAFLRANVEKYDGAAPVIDGLPFFIHAHRFGTPLLFNIYVGEKPRKKYYIERERATPYSYAVRLGDFAADFKIAVEKHSAIFSVDFSKSPNEARFLHFFDKMGVRLVSAKGNVVWLEYSIDKDGKIYAAMEFSENAESVECGKRDLKIKFGAGVKTLAAKYGVSLISPEKAADNLGREIAGFDLRAVESAGRAAWNDALSTIKVKSPDENLKTVFYTAYWRTFERMHNIDEYGVYFNCYTKTARPSIDGKYLYTDDWPWDTYRALHPLRVLLEPQCEEKCLESFLEYAGAHPDKWLPKFINAEREMFNMNGNHIVASFMDAAKKGLKVDAAKALEHALLTVDERTLLPDSLGRAGSLSAFYKERGYIPAIPEGAAETNPEVERAWAKRQAVSATMATSYDDWCIAELAKMAGRADVAEKFVKRAKNYQKLFNPKTKFFEPKDADGNFVPIKNHLTDGGVCFRYYYTENNAYVYRFDAEHDMDGLAALYGGDKGFEKALDELFEAHLDQTKHHYFAIAPDHAGIMGAFATGNEPCFRIPYLYNRAGAPWKAQRIIRHAIDTWFRNDPMGYPGDDDGGAMSAFVVFSMLGVYPVNIANAEYEFGTPFFDEAEIKFGSGKSLRVKAGAPSAERRYVQGVKVGGKDWNSYSISHADLLNAGEIEFEMGGEPNKSLFNKSK